MILLDSAIFDFEMLAPSKSHSRWFWKIQNQRENKCYVAFVYRERDQNPKYLFVVWEVN